MCRSLAVRRSGHNEVASPNFVVAEGDVLFLATPNKEILEQIKAKHGEAPGAFTKDRSDLDYLRVFASKPSVVGRALGDIKLPGEYRLDRHSRAPGRQRPAGATRPRARVR